MKIRLKPPQIIILGFVSVIFTGTILLLLPFSLAEGKAISFIDTLFTAASAVCVTGLTVNNISKVFSPMGQVIIALLIQIGGLGIMTFSTMFAIMLGRKLTISENVTIQSAIGHTKVEGLKHLIIYIVAFTLSIEIIGAALLYTRWHVTKGWSGIGVWGTAAFHSVSAFCNAGFSIFSDNLVQFRGDNVVIAIVCSLIVIGGLGFIVFLDIQKLKFWRKDRVLIASRISLQTKIVLIITLLLILAGALGVFIFEDNAILNGMPWNEKINTCVFTSITPRTAGFNIVDTAALRPVTLFMIILLMFIGASPGGTGGGIKTVTFGIILASFRSMFYNRERITLFNRTIPREAYRKAAIIFFLSLCLVFISTFLLSLTETAIAETGHGFLNLLFEAVSAFGTVGLSAGATPNLSVFGKIIIIITMFIGRVGPLTLALAIAMRREKIAYRYPEEKLMVG